MTTPLGARRAVLSRLEEMLKMTLARAHPQWPYVLADAWRLAVKREFTLVGTSTQGSLVGAASRLKIVWLALTAPFPNWISARHNFKITMLIGTDRIPVVLSEWADLRVLAATLIKGEYEVELNPAPKTIVDIGANIGDTAVWYAHRFRNADIFAFEPVKATFQKLEVAVASIPRAQAFNLAVTNETSTTQMDVSGSSWEAAEARSDVANGTGDYTLLETVNTLAFGELFKFLQLEAIDLLSIDAEGAEWKIFRELKANWPVSHLVVEIHESLFVPAEPDETVSSVLSGLRQEGYEILTFDPVDPGNFAEAHPPWGQRLLYIRNTARLGSALDQADS